MKKRGRPSEQLKKETAEGRVWTIVSKLRNEGDYGKSIREIARLSRCSIGAVAKTLAWQGYLRERREQGTDCPIVSTTRTRRRRLAESIEGRVIQIVKDAGNDYSRTVREIAALIGCSSASVARTEAWKGYMRARELDKEVSQNRRRRDRIK